MKQIHLEIRIIIMSGNILDEILQVDDTTA